MNEEQTPAERWREAVSASAGYFEEGIVRQALRRREREAHRFRTWLALRIAPWLAP